MFDRRLAQRQPVDVFFNKYVGGCPYLCRASNLSESGMLAWTGPEPDGARERFVVELRFGGMDRSVWVWARTAWTRGRAQAIEFLRMHDADRTALEAALGSSPA